MKAEEMPIRDFIYTKELPFFPCLTTGINSCSQAGLLSCQNRRMETNLSVGKKDRIMWKTRCETSDRRITFDSLVLSMTANLIIRDSWKGIIKHNTKLFFAGETVSNLFQTRKTNKYYCEKAGLIL